MRLNQSTKSENVHTPLHLKERFTVLIIIYIQDST